MWWLGIVAEEVRERKRMSTAECSYLIHYLEYLGYRSLPGTYTAACGMPSLDMNHTPHSCELPLFRISSFEDTSTTRKHLAGSNTLPVLRTPH